MSHLFSIRVGCLLVRPQGWRCFAQGWRAGGGREGVPVLGGHAAGALRFGDEVRLQPRFLGDFLSLESVGTMRFTETLRMLKQRMRESRFAAWP